MTFSKIKFFGFLSLSCSLITCGQTQALTAPNVMPNTIAQASTTTNAPLSEAKCKQVVAKVKDVLGTTPNVKVTNNSRFSGLSVPYPDRSANLNRQYILTLSGSGVSDFWKSGKEV
jgi:hypothetical protein